MKGIRIKARIRSPFTHPYPFCVQLPDTIPVMVLPRCSLLPHGLLPLFIFEPRYRAMLQHALQHERLFCVGMRTDHEDDEADEAIHGHSTAAMVRACVHHEDGTSHLMLQGVKRIRFAGWSQRTPFRIARIEPVETVISCRKEMQRLRCEVLKRVCSRVCGPDAKSLTQKMKAICDTEVLTDFVAANFLNDASHRQQTLGMCDLNDRLRYLAEVLAPS
jgi:Lon protease-like protein